jgi:hypothetical protein
MPAGPSWVWLVPLAIAAPWIVAIAFYWRKAANLRDGSVTPSLAELVKARLWTR